MKFLVAISITLLAFVALAAGKAYSAEEFTAELNKAGITGRDAAIFSCIAEHVSGWQTTAHVVGAYSSDFGVFQISNAYWCSPPGKSCGVACESLLDDDIQDDINCALQIRQERGFWAWQAYEAYCKNI